MGRPDIELFACDELFGEFERVRQYPKLLKIMKPSRVAITFELMQAKSVMVSISNRVADFIDPKDNYLLDLCLAVDADFLVTGDRRVLALGNFGRTRILAYRAFCEMLGV